MVVVLPLPAGPVSSNSPADWRRKRFQLDGGVFRDREFPDGFDRREVEQPEDDFFPGHGRVGGHADIVRAAELRVLNSAILRQGILIGLEPRKEFDATEDAFGERGSQGGNGGDNAIQAEGDFRVRPPHLEVNVAGARSGGLANEVGEGLRGVKFAGVESVGCGEWWCHRSWAES